MTSELVLTRWRGLLDPDGETWPVGDWGAAFDELERPREYLGKDSHPGWSPARFEPCRRGMENVREVFALCLDFDDGETIEEITEKLSGYYGLLHTSRKHTPEAHRFRVVLPLSRPVSPFEFAALWVRFAPFAGTVDPSPKDASRFWFLSGTPEGGEFRSVRLNGDPLNVDWWLAKPDPTAHVPVPHTSRERSETDIEENARRYIARMPPAISGSQGHKATFDVAVALACGFSLSEDATFRVLWNDYNPRCQPPWSEPALRHKAKGAAASVRVGRGYLINDWEPSRSTRPAPEMPPPEYWDDGHDDAIPGAAITSFREMGDDSEQIAAEQAKKTAVEKWGARSMREVLTEVFVDATKPTRSIGLTTGIGDLDEQMGGYRSGDITILGGQTSWGKSSFAVMALTENQPKGYKILVLSSEDKELLYGRRIACRKGSFSALRMRDGQLRADEISSLGAMVDRATDEPVFLDVVGMPVEDIAKATRELCAEVGFDLVVVDYLQRLRAKRQLDRRAEVTFAAAILSDEIKRAKAAGLILSQLKRTEGKEPTLDDLKESGDIENMAEHVALGWRVVGSNKVERKLGLRKSKDGPVDGEWITLPFDEKTASFLTMPRGGHSVYDNQDRGYDTEYDTM